jgi:hypothetical protein
LAWSDDLRPTRSTRTPTKVSQFGPERFTAAVIAASRAARLIVSRVVGSAEPVPLKARAVMFVSPNQCLIWNQLEYLRKAIIRKGPAPLSSPTLIEKR